MRYLADTRTVGIAFEKGNGLDIKTYTNVDYARDKDD